jgi:hypothetical protein
MRRETAVADRRSFQMRIAISIDFPSLARVCFIRIADLPPSTGLEADAGFIERFGPHAGFFRTHLSDPVVTRLIEGQWAGESFIGTEERTGAVDTALSTR